MLPSNVINIKGIILHKITISDAEFIRFQSFLKSSSDISLAENKKYLIINRLKPVLHTTGLDSLCDIISLVEATPTGDLASKVIDAMTTNCNPPIPNRC
ncbi:MAG: hypothetical protein COB62_01520 [Piscirickettsiaceae bacterium]|nr:MAG: hypothetical protein COB62_01520 [Piscirickettsiaceae bacterium]